MVAGGSSFRKNVSERLNALEKRVLDLQAAQASESYFQLVT